MAQTVFNKNRILAAFIQTRQPGFKFSVRRALRGVGYEPEARAGSNKYKLPKFKTWLITIDSANNQTMVSVIEYWNLDIVWKLQIGIWDLVRTCL